MYTHIYTHTHKYHTICNHYIVSQCRLVSLQICYNIKSMTSASIAHLRKYFQDYNVEEYFGIKHELHFGR